MIEMVEGRKAWDQNTIYEIIKTMINWLGNVSNKPSQGYSIMS